MQRLGPLFVTAFTLAAAAPAGAERALSLADAISLARQRSGVLRAAEVEVTRARLQVLERQLARVELDITGTAQALYRHTTPLTPGPCPTPPCAGGILQAALTGNLRVPLWTGLALESSLAQAHQHARSVEASRRSALRGLQLDVAQAYWEVRRKELAAEVATQLLGNFRELETLTQKRVDSGIAPLVDHNRARAATLAASTQLMALERDVGIAHAQLRALLQLDEPLRLTDDPLNYRTMLPALDEVLREALQARPELVVADADYEAARLGVRMAKGAYWPQLAVVAQSELAVANDAAALAAAPSDGAMPEPPLAGSSAAASAPAASPAPVGPAATMVSAMAGVQLTWTIFDMLGTWLRVRDAALTRDSAHSERERRRYEVLAEVQAAHTQLREALRAQDPSRRRTELARTDLQLLRRRYEAGAGPLLDVLDAQAQLLQSALDVIDRAVDLAEADLQLKAALGRL